MTPKKRRLKRITRNGLVTVGAGVIWGTICAWLLVPVAIIGKVWEFVTRE